MASVWYNKGIYMMATGAVDLDTYGSFRMHLAKSTYTPSAHAHDDVADVTLCDASSYTSQALPSGSITVTESSDGNVYFDFTDSVVWSSLGGTTNNSIRYAIVYMNNSTNDAGQNLIACLDFGASTIQTTNGSDFKVTINASGIGKITT